MSTFLFFVICAAVLGAAYYFGKQRADRLISEGKIISRDANFYKYAEIFAVKGMSFRDLLAEVKNTDYSDLKVTLYPFDSEIVFKSGNSWNAKISDQGVKDDRNRFKFEFTAWTENKYNVPYGVETMNMMETKIEKMFLKHDESTKVEKEEIKLTTKRKFF